MTPGFGSKRQQQKINIMENSMSFKVLKLSTNEIKKVGMTKRQAQNWIRQTTNPADFSIIDPREAAKKAATPSFRVAFIQNIFDTVLRTIVEAAEIQMDDRDFTIDVDCDLFTQDGDYIGKVAAKVFNRVKSSRVHGSREHDIAPESPEVDFVLETACVNIINQRGETSTNITAAVNARLATYIGKTNL